MVCSLLRRNFSHEYFQPLTFPKLRYNQIQSFQVNDYANHYVDIEITGYRKLYSIYCKQQCLHMYGVCVCVVSIPSFVSNYTIIRSSYYNRANILQAVTSKADI